MNPIYACDLRRQQTSPENLIWAALRRNQLGDFKFKCQIPIGTYIADFANFAGKLIIRCRAPSNILIRCGPNIVPSEGGHRSI